MAQRLPSTIRPTKPQNHDLLWKGMLCTVIGLAVLIGPSFMHATPMRDTVAQSAAVGWFSLVLGVAFTAHYLWQRRSAKPPAD